MYYDLDNLEIEILDSKNYFQGITFIYNSKKYYYKPHKIAEDCYNELIAEKIANRLGIKCCHYFLGSYLGKDGVISEYFEDSKYISMCDYLQEKYKEEVEERSDLEDIWYAFYSDFQEDTVKKLMKELINIFIFDILIANPDRHNENYGLILDGENTHFAPIFDNEKALSPISYKEGYYSLEIEVYDPQANYSQIYNRNILYNFLDISDESYHELLKEKLEIISEESINEIFTELASEGVEIEQPIKVLIQKRFADNLLMINKCINNIKKR